MWEYLIPFLQFKNKLKMKKVSDSKFGGSLPSMNKISGKQLHIADRLHVVSIKVILIRKVFL